MRLIIWVLLSLILGAFEIFSERIELALPELPIGLNPIRRRLERCCLKRAESHPSIFVAGNEARIPEHTEMTRNRRKRDIERLRQIADRRMTGGESRKNGAPGRVGEGRENTGERLGFILNHYVKYKSLRDFVNTPHGHDGDCHETVTKPYRPGRIASLFLLSRRIADGKKYGHKV